MSETTIIRRLHAPFVSEMQIPRQAKRNRQLDFATLEPRQLLANVTSADLGGQWGLDAQHELSVRQYLDQQSDTDYLQQGANELQLVEILLFITEQVIMLKQQELMLIVHLI